MSQNRGAAMGGAKVREPLKKVVSVPPVMRKSSKSRSFHFRYLELCRAKNIQPIADIRAKSNTTFLELFADRLAINDWLLINEALHHDLVLQTLHVRIRRILPQSTIEPIDSEKRARLYRTRPVIYTRFVFAAMVNAIGNCVELNKNLTTLKLEGLPLQESYIEIIAKALASNESLVTLCFRKSPIGDRGCSLVCNTAKYLNTIEVFDVSECNLTAKGAEAIADMIKMQKITRFSEGWEKSLRYRSVDVNAIAGLRIIKMANNPEIGDDGVRFIAEVLKEDAWIKNVDMEGCGITDIGANLILSCLEVNNAVTDFNVHNNEGISKFIYRSIREHLKGPNEEQPEEPQYDLSCVNGLQSLPKNKKFTVSQLLNHIKNLEEQLSFERTLRKKAEKLNEKLSQHLMAAGSSAPTPSDKMIETPNMPNGYVLVRNESLHDIIKETQSYSKSSSSRLVNSLVTSPEGTPRSDIATLRKEHQQQMSMQDQLKPVLKEESQSEAEMRANGYMDEQQPRKLYHVRKVRSEMKYVETNLRDNSNHHESKSDHEFANERDFNLNPMVQFETDIGDSMMVNQQDRRRKEGGCGDGDYPPYGYEDALKKQTMGRNGNPIERGQYGDTRKPLNNDGMHRNFGGSGDGGRVSQYMAEIERKTANRSGKKRQKPKSEEGSHHTESYMHRTTEQVETYMSNYEDDGLETNFINSGSEADTTDTTIRGQASPNGKFTGMKVFMRRTSKQSVDNHSNDENGSGNTDDDILSPRSVYLEMQRKQEQNSYSN
ncbi:protein Cep78 homolog [Drosophila tropicalis]|uniref:protein Cep78 homolog n=1 Tax=Drosophila tropicalis TaxID=46794 RepID=UPI0035ABFA2C